MRMLGILDPRAATIQPVAPPLPLGSRSEVLLDPRRMALARGHFPIRTNRGVAEAAEGSRRKAEENIEPFFAEASKGRHRRSYIEHRSGKAEEASRQGRQFFLPIP